MERIDLALFIQIFKGFKSTLPRPAGFVNLRGAGQGKTCFLRGRAALFSAGRGGAGRGGAHIPARVTVQLSIK